MWKTTCWKFELFYWHGVLVTCVFVCFATKHVVLFIEAAPVLAPCCLPSLLTTIKLVKTTSFHTGPVYMEEKNRVLFIYTAKPSNGKHGKKSCSIIIRNIAMWYVLAFTGWNMNFISFIKFFLIKRVYIDVEYNTTICLFFWITVVKQQWSCCQRTLKRTKWYLYAKWHAFLVYAEKKTNHRRKNTTFSWPNSVIIKLLSLKCVM